MIHVKQHWYANENCCNPCLVLEARQPSCRPNAALFHVAYQWCHLCDAPATASHWHNMHALNKVALKLLHVHSCLLFSVATTPMCCLCAAAETSDQQNNMPLLKSELNCLIDRLNFNIQRKLPTLKAVATS
jgi:hypothetical protein